MRDTAEIRNCLPKSFLQPLASLSCAIKKEQHGSGLWAFVSPRVAHTLFARRRLPDTTLRQLLFLSSPSIHGISPFGRHCRRAAFPNDPAKKVSRPFGYRPRRKPAPSISKTKSRMTPVVLSALTRDAEMRTADVRDQG